MIWAPQWLGGACSDIGVEFESLEGVVARQRGRDQSKVPEEGETA
jgi:hypothetical protein